MNRVLNHQQVNGSANSLYRRGWMMPSALLWIIQGVLAFIFLFAGSMKLIVPVEVLLAQMPLPLPGLFIHFIGIIEVAGALGLILPRLLRIWPNLTFLAACGLFIEMLGATGYTVLGGSIVAALMPLLVGILCLFVAYGRRAS